MYKITDETRKAVFAIIANKPFQEVSGVNVLLSKEEVTEQEGNNILALLSNYPYKEVYEFFNNVPSLFVASIEDDVEHNTQTSVEE